MERGSRYNRLRSTQRVGEGIFPGEATKRGWFLTFFVLFGIFSVFGLTGFITHFVDKSSLVRTISGVSPLGGEITVLGDDGIEVVPSVGTNSITHKNELVRDTRLSTGLPQSPTIWYFHDTGLVAAENVWFMGNGAATYYPFFMPGVLPGQDGQGNVGGTVWTIPAVGYYSVAVSCLQHVTPITPGDFISFELSMSLGATGTDPTTGQRPSGADQTVYLSAGNPTESFSYVSSTANFHAGCPGCIFTIGQQLTLHFRTNHAGAGPAVSTEVSCNLEVSRHK